MRVIWSKGGLIESGFPFPVTADFEIFNAKFNESECPQKVRLHQIPEGEGGCRKGSRRGRSAFPYVIDAEKHDLQRISTFRGMQIDFIDQFKKHESSIRVSRDSFSNVIDSSFDSENHHLPRISLSFGITKD
jgi:hypothetical protein